VDTESAEMASATVILDSLDLTVQPRWSVPTSAPPTVSVSMDSATAILDSKEITVVAPLFAPCLNARMVVPDNVVAAETVSSDAVYVTLDFPVMTVQLLSPVQ